MGTVKKIGKGFLYLRKNYSYYADSRRQWRIVSSNGDQADGNRAEEPDFGDDPLGGLSTDIQRLISHNGLSAAGGRAPPSTEEENTEVIALPENRERF